MNSSRGLKSEIYRKIKELDYLMPELQKFRISLVNIPRVHPEKRDRQAEWGRGRMLFTVSKRYLGNTKAYHLQLQAAFADIYIL